MSYTHYACDECGWDFGAIGWRDGKSVAYWEWLAHSETHAEAAV